MALSTEGIPVQPPVARPAAPLPPRIGDVVLVKLDQDLIRPLLITWSGLYVDGDLSEPRVCGVVFCEPDDHNTLAFRNAVHTPGARFVGHPYLQMPFGRGENLARGTAIGEWVPKPTLLPARS